MFSFNQAVDNTLWLFILLLDNSCHLLHHACLLLSIFGLIEWFSQKEKKKTTIENASTLVIVGIYTEK